MTKSEAATREEEILKFWQENNIFEKTLNKEAPNGDFVFYEGPPTANGKPGIHHLESRAFKDAIPRYKTMQGYKVDRPAGWDTHGLPVELEIEKKLGFKGKPDIEEYGIAEFNQKCRESVLEYVDLWKKFTSRIGYWLDYDNEYWTFTPDYMESVWWTFAQAEKKGLLYKDYKVLPWCSRCGTALSSHELAQGYKDVKDLSVTAQFELVDPPSHEAPEGHVNQKTYILAWTTTPWTLPGNVGLAVGADIDYVKITYEENNYILAKDLIERVLDGKEYEVVDEFKGENLVGKYYKPLYPYFKTLAEIEGVENLENAYQVYAADFVTTEDGTGIVHTAVMYGQDDFELGNKVGLPKFHLVNPEGEFVEGTDFLEGRFVKDEEVAIDIIKNLAHRGLLFSKEKYEHSYPFCWRCKTPLIYYARDSFYIRMSKLRDQLLKNNSDVNWEPDYIKEGRMGEWLSGIKDWAVSRERYWGTPLPIWQSEDGDTIVVDSVQTLKNNLPKTTFIFVRHGEAGHNVSGIADSKTGSTYDLTKKGIEQIKQTAEKLSKYNIDKIISSPLLRSIQTSKLLAKELGINQDIEISAEVREIEFGEYEGKKLIEWHEARHQSSNDYTYKPKDGESFADVKNRVNKFLNETAKKFPDQTIVVATHGAVLEVAQPAADGQTVPEAHTYFQENKGPANGSVLEVDFYPLPFNRDGELDLHRPYIDEVVLEKDGKKYYRVPEVMDVWFDSGSMPYAQDHYPFKYSQKEVGNDKFQIPNPKSQNLAFPADYISEGIDQTRGWFYTLQAISTYLGFGTPYKNVTCLGLIMDAEGQKMSKSKGNTVDPWLMIDKYGADALRFWMYSVNQPGESKNFDEKTVDEIIKKLFNLLRNSLVFYNLYKIEPSIDTSIDPSQSPHVLDKWIIEKLSQLQLQVTNSLNNYQLLEATRPIREFVGEFSQWYIRRSRDRFKGEDNQDKEYALATTRYVILELSKFLAPFTPFFAEEIYQGVEGEKESVHLEDWPEYDHVVDEELLENMRATREIVSIALQARAEADIKVRQPLAKLQIKSSLPEEFRELIQDEVNVKDVVVDSDLGQEIVLDTEITSELREEGEMRELIRSIQSERKKMGLQPDQVVILTLAETDLNKKLVENWGDEIKNVTNTARINWFKDTEALEEGFSIELDAELD